MKYTKEFKEVTKLNTYIGTGNPNAKILIVGKEVATDIENGTDKRLEEKNLKDFNKNIEYWKNNIQKQINQDEIPNWCLDKKENNPLFAFKGVKPAEHREGQTWRKYQKLHDYVYPKFALRDKYEPYNFQERFFITEMSILPSKRTSDARLKNDFKNKLKERKEQFFSSSFIQNFPVIILACSNYITGEELTKIFKVEFVEQKGNDKQKFWVHKNKNNTKLVIHTRQLSANVSNDLLISIANEISNFIGN